MHQTLILASSLPAGPPIDPACGRSKANKMMARLLRASALTCLVMLGLPAVSNAAVRYASGSGAGVACSQAAPCSVTEAIQSANDNDTVQLAPDEYNLTGNRINVWANNLTIQGPDTVGDSFTFIPYLMFSTDNFAVTGGSRLMFFGVNPTIRNLGITGEGTTLVGTGAGNPAVTMDRVIINSFEPGGGVAFEGDNAVITNSVIRRQGGNSFGRAMEATGTLTGSLVYSESNTAISLDGAFHVPGACTLTVRNSIVWGGGKNLAIEGDASPANCSPITIDYDYSWIPSTASSQTGGGFNIGGFSSINQGLNNLPNTPAAVDPLNPGAMTPPAGSPAINAGCSLGCGSHDYYGRPRPIGSANDIGPYEASLSPTLSAVTVGSITASQASVAATINPNYAATTYNFQIRKAGASEWGSFDGATTGPGTSGQSISGTANPLEPSTDYEVRLVATNSAGETAATPTTFRTAAPSPSPSPTPSLSVSGVKTKVSKKGLYITSLITVSGAGEIKQSATSKRGAKSTTWCRVNKTVSAAGSYTLKCNLGRRGRRSLQKNKMSLTLRTSFKPSGGNSLVQNKTIKLKKKR